MADVVFAGVSKRFGSAAPVLSGLELTVHDGEFMVLVGPSGCGKTTTLRLLAGLDQVSEGRILIGGRDVTALPAAQRDVAMVFQSYALYPQMTVAQNMGFALRVAGRPAAEVRDAVRRVAAALQLEDLLERKPGQLSGGQRQRVAIGRAIVREPAVFLFDEPLSNLDAALRQQTRIELARLHERLAATVIYVTHDQVEAMTLGQRIAIFHQGRVDQVGTPLELYRAPVNRFVASFLGTPPINLLSGTVGGGGFELAGGGVLPAPHLGPDLAQRVRSIGVRPEHLRLVAPGERVGLPGRLELIEHLGDSSIAYVDRGPGEPAIALKLDAGACRGLERHQPVCLSCLPEHVLPFDEQGWNLSRPAV